MAAAKGVPVPIERAFRYPTSDAARRTITSSGSKFQRVNNSAGSGAAPQYGSQIPELAPPATISQRWVRLAAWLVGQREPLARQCWQDHPPRTARSEEH